MKKLTGWIWFAVIFWVLVWWVLLSVGLNILEIGWSAYYSDMWDWRFWLYRVLYYIWVIILWCSLWVVIDTFRWFFKVFWKVIVALFCVYVWIIFIPHFLFWYTSFGADVLFRDTYFWWMDHSKFMWFIWTNLTFFCVLWIVYILDLIPWWLFRGFAGSALIALCLPIISWVINQWDAVHRYIKLHSLVWVSYLPTSQINCHEKFSYEVCQWLSNHLWEERTPVYCDAQKIFDTDLPKKRSGSSYFNECINSSFEKTVEWEKEYSNCAYKDNPGDCLMQHAVNNLDRTICSTDLWSAWYWAKVYCENWYDWSIARKKESMVRTCSKKAWKDSQSKCVIDYLKIHRSIEMCDTMNMLFPWEDNESLIRQCKDEWKSIIKNRNSARDNSFQRSKKYGNVKHDAILAEHQTWVLVFIIFVWVYIFSLRSKEENEKE